MINKFCKCGHGKNLHGYVWGCFYTSNCKCKTYDEDLNKCYHKKVYALNKTDAIGHQLFDCICCHKELFRSDVEVYESFIVLNSDEKKPLTTKETFEKFHPLHEICSNGYHVPEYVEIDLNDKNNKYCTKCKMFFGKIILYSTPMNNNWIYEMCKEYYDSNDIIILPWDKKWADKSISDKEKDNTTTVYNATPTGISSTSFDKTKIRQELKPNWLIIKEWLLKYHGLYITNRQIGKTKALLEILKDDPDAMLVVHKEAYAHNVRERIRKEYDDQKTLFYTIKNRTKVNENKCDSMLRRVCSYHIYKQNFLVPNNINKLKVYFDEYFYLDGGLPTNFAGAVSSMKFPVKIERFKIPSYNDYGDKKDYGDEEKYYQLEETMEFK